MPTKNAIFDCVSGQENHPQLDYPPTIACTIRAGITVLATLENLAFNTGSLSSVHCYTPVKKLLYNSIRKKVQHFDCLTGTVRLELLKLTVKKRLLTGDVTFRENVLLTRRGITKQLLTVSRATVCEPVRPINSCPRPQSTTLYCSMTHFRLKRRDGVRVLPGT